MSTLVDAAYALKRRLYERKLSAARAQETRPAALRILIVMDAGIGNAIEATPLVQAVRAFRPSAHIAIVAPKGDLFDDWCVVDQVIHTGDAAGVFDEQYVCWSCQPFEGSGGEVRHAQGLFPLWQLRPERELNMDMVRHLGYAGGTPPLYVGMRAPASPLPPAPLRIGLCAGGKAEHRWRHKRWPYWRELARLLRERNPEAQLLLMDGDLDGIDGVDLRHLGLRECAHVFRQCQLVIGNDSGPMHIADAVLAPHLTIFGPTCEIKNGPRNRGEGVRHEVECSPCQYDIEMLDSCPKARCMEGLSALDVLARAVPLLRRPGATSSSSPT